MHLYRKSLEPWLLRKNSDMVAEACMNLWILQKRPSGLAVPYELARLRD